MFPFSTLTAAYSRLHKDHLLFSRKLKCQVYSENFPCTRVNKCSHQIVETQTKQSGAVKKFKSNQCGHKTLPGRFCPTLNDCEIFLSLSPHSAVSQSCSVINRKELLHNGCGLLHMFTSHTVSAPFKMQWDLVY